LAAAEHGQPAHRGCCEHRHAISDNHTQPSHDHDEANDASGGIVVVGVRALECGGNASWWLVLASTVVPMAPVTCDIDQTAGEWISLGDDSSLHVTLLLDSPPPEAAKA
jgi:hypothetical protein